MHTDNKSISELKTTLISQWDIKCFIDLGDITVSPQQIYQTFNKHYQSTFKSDDRLVFYTSHVIPDSLLIHLYRATTLIDISNFFILLCTPHDLSKKLSDIANTYVTDLSPFQTLTVPNLKDTNELLENYVLPDTVCPLPWMHLEITHGGAIRPCCVYQGTVGNIKDQSLRDTFNDNAMSLLRNKLLTGEKPSGCKICWANEQQGLTSNRTQHVKLLKKSLVTEFLSEPKIVSLDLKPGNTCNFKCRICGPESSSLHANEISQLLKINTVPPVDWINHDHCIDQLINLLPDLKNIDMYGGEPFLIKRFDSLLITAVKQGHAKNIRLHYNTNGSVYPQQLIPHWQHFQHVDIQVSIDNIGKRFELERGGTWSAVEQNIKKMLDLNLSNLTISIMPTINIMNVFYIGELVDWAKSLGLNVNPLYVYHPAEFSIKNLTKDAKELITKKYQNHDWPELSSILETINNCPDSNGISFVNKTRHFDSIRQENFAETHPEIANAMGYVYNKDL